VLGITRPSPFVPADLGGVSPESWASALAHPGAVPRRKLNVSGHIAATSAASKFDLRMWRLA